MNELVSPVTFKWILTALTGGLAGTWAIYDAISLIRMRKADRADPIVRDKRFGYLVGIAIGVIGVVGCLRFHDVV
jgi:hypothetical protein